MLAEALGTDLYIHWYEYINDEQTRDAYCYIVGLAASLRKHKCYPRQKGEVRDVRFEGEMEEVPFAFIVNKESLLFYFRLPAVRSGRYSIDKLEVAFDFVNQNPAGEWTVRLRSIADVKRLWAILNLS